jgi:hypothetical protein
MGLVKTIIRRITFGSFATASAGFLIAVASMAICTLSGWDAIGGFLGWVILTSLLTMAAAAVTFGIMVITWGWGGYIILPVAIFFSIWTFTSNDGMWNHYANLDEVATYFREEYAVFDFYEEDEPLTSMEFVQYVKRDIKESYQDYGTFGLDDRLDGDDFEGDWDKLMAWFASHDYPKESVPEKYQLRYMGSADRIKGATARGFSELDKRHEPSPNRPSRAERMKAKRGY